MSKENKIWKPRPDREDYGAAAKFLGLMFPDKDVRRMVRQLRGTATLQHQAKDLLRASECILLDKDSDEVAADLKKIEKGKKLSPVLLIRGQARAGVPLIIADGHHRICACWYWDESIPVACRIAAWPK